MNDVILYLPTERKKIVQHVVENICYSNKCIPWAKDDVLTGWSLYTQMMRMDVGGFARFNVTFRIFK